MDSSRECFEELAKPLIKWLNEYHNPYAKIIIEPDRAELVYGEMSVRTDEYIKD